MLPISWLFDCLFLCQWDVFIFILFYIFETGSPCVTIAVQELTLHQADLELKRSICTCLLSARNKGMHHYSWVLFFYCLRISQYIYAIHFDKVHPHFPSSTISFLLAIPLFFPPNFVSSFLAPPFFFKPTGPA